MNKLTKTQTTYLVGALITVIMLVVSYALVWNPRKAHADDLHAQAEQQEYRNAQMERQIASLNSLLLAADDIVATGRSHTDQFPPTAELPKLFADIQKAANNAGINDDNVVQIAPSSPNLISSDGKGEGAGLPSQSKESALAQMQVVVKVTSSYAETVQFLKNIEKMKRIYLIESVQVDKESDNRYTVVLTGDMFLMRQDTLDQLLELNYQLLLDNMIQLIQIYLEILPFVQKVKL